MLEGYIDLLVRGAQGLIVVDYKTDSVGGDDELQAKLERYRAQLGAYGSRSSRCSAGRVARARLVFCPRRRAGY